MNRNNHLETYISFQSINADVVINCIDTFFIAINQQLLLLIRLLFIGMMLF
jgi:hypothetical protein